MPHLNVADMEILAPTTSVHSSSSNVLVPFHAKQWWSWKTLCFVIELHCHLQWHEPLAISSVEVNSIMLDKDFENVES